MKFITGLALGLAGYAAWTLSEPGPGEPDGFIARLPRLRAEWQKAVNQGRAAGDIKREHMEREFETMLRQSSS